MRPMIDDLVVMIKKTDTWFSGVPNVRRERYHEKTGYPAREHRWFVLSVFHRAPFHRRVGRFRCRDFPDFDRSRADVVLP